MQNVLPLLKTSSLPARKHYSTQSNKKQLKYNRLQVRICVNKYWQQLGDPIQSAAVSRNNRGLNEGIKKALGPTQSKTVPLNSTSGEVITDKGKHADGLVGGALF